MLSEIKTQNNNLQVNNSAIKIYINVEEVLKSLKKNNEYIYFTETIPNIENSKLYSTKISVTNKQNLLKELNEQNDYILIKEVGNCNSEIENLNSNLKNCSNNLKNIKYFIFIIKSNFLYKGYIDKIYQREFFGINRYQNKDVYLGEFLLNNRQGSGYYKYNCNNTDDLKQTYLEHYIGIYNNDKIDKIGAYLWLNEEFSKHILYNNISFKLQIGYIENNKFNSGLFISKTNENMYIYFGGFYNGLKDDTEAIIYDSNNESFYYGEVSRNNLIKGYLISLKKNSIYNKYNANTDINTSNISKNDNSNISDIVSVSNISKNSDTDSFDNNLYDECYRDYSIIFIEMENNLPYHVTKEHKISSEVKKAYIKKIIEFKKIINPKKYCQIKTNDSSNISIFEEILINFKKLNDISNNLINTNKESKYMPIDDIKVIYSLITKDLLIKAIDNIEKSYIS